MKLFSILPKDREHAGAFFVLEGDAYVLGPEWCRGEGDNAAAVEHGNREEDPTRPFGDHPAGLYLVKDIVEKRGEARGTYGPFFVVLDPVEGEALRAKNAGRTGLGIHGGKPGPVGTPNELRATYGCLRVENGVLAVLVGMLKAHLSASRLVRYECRVIGG